jgi:hypothetical protein
MSKEKMKLTVERRNKITSTNPERAYPSNPGSNRRRMRISTSSWSLRQGTSKSDIAKSDEEDLVMPNCFYENGMQQQWEISFK